LEGVTIKVAVTSGLKGAARLLDEIKDGKSPYHFIEVMGCPGGCISGGGQPRPVDNAIRMKRLEAIYREDEGKKLRKSHENADIQTLYKEFLGQPLGHLSHELLHTHYLKRNKN
jgi:NADH-quinone oxidoreductase subunit G/NADP-reducing hydrogenase subunit HndD